MQQYTTVNNAQIKKATNKGSILVESFYHMYSGYIISYCADNYTMGLYRKSKSKKKNIKVGEIMCDHRSMALFAFGWRTTDPKVNCEKEESFMKTVCRHNLSKKWDNASSLIISNQLLKKYISGPHWTTSMDSLEYNIIRIKRSISPSKSIEVGKIVVLQDQVVNDFINAEEESLFRLHMGKKYGIAMDEFNYTVCCNTLLQENKMEVQNTEPYVPEFVPTFVM
jgi:hypothetical protein